MQGSNQEPGNALRDGLANSADSHRRVDQASLGCRAGLQQLFLESASEVLETMFFTGVAEEDSSEDEMALVSAELTFHGKPSGKFGVRVPLATGRAIASSFLGLDEVSDKQVGEVVCELTNMICGSVLSHMEAGARFELMHPEIDVESTDWREHPGAIGYTFSMDEGAITMWMAEAKPHLVCPGELKFAQADDALRSSASATASAPMSRATAGTSAHATRSARGQNSTHA